MASKQKYGRHKSPGKKKNKQSQKRYVASARCQKNKLRRAKARAKRLAKAALTAPRRRVAAERRREERRKAKAQSHARAVEAA